MVVTVPKCMILPVNGIVNDNAFLLLSLAYRLVSSFCVDVDCDGKHVLVAEAYG